MLEHRSFLSSQPARTMRILLVLAGIVLGQIVLYAPSLLGLKVLLPLDTLAQPNVYIPRTPGGQIVEEKDRGLTDWIYVYEPSRRFAVSEFRAGRLPAWAPYQFAGVPFIWPRFSPFLLFECCTQAPVILAWGQLLAALFAGAGAYLFFRRVLTVSFWPAAFGAWCYPLTGFFIFWQGCPSSLPAYGLPWILLAVSSTVQRPGAIRVAGLGVATCLVLISGFIDVAGQVLLASGLFGLWRISELWRAGQLRHRWKGVTTRLALGWALGLMLAAPYLLPIIEYTRTGARMARRGAGQEERPPVGISALPQVLLPDIYGNYQKGSVRLVSGHQAESSAGAFVGVLATLLAAPLAFCSRRHRPVTVFCSVLALFGVAWCLNVPGVVSLLRLPGLNMMSHNRLVFLTCFGVLSLAVVGLEVLIAGVVKWRWWFWLNPVLLGGLCIWCVFRSTHLPEPLLTQIPHTILQGKEVGWVHDLQGLSRLQGWFIERYAVGAIWCGLGVIGWLVIRNGRYGTLASVHALGALMVVELLWFAHGRNPQCDPALYYPSIDVLQSVAKAPAGRVVGYNCLPAPLSSIAGLCDIRGYDAVDPGRIVELVDSAADPATKMPGYAATMQVAPKAVIDHTGKIRLSPVLDMLGVRYVILRGSPPTNACPTFRGVDYWVLTNPAAMPRVFVPSQVQTVAQGKDRLAKLSSPIFNPREVAYVEVPVSLVESCNGEAEITSESPNSITVSARMQTAGLVVLADRWDIGWRAYLDSKTQPILVTNHAIRGVIVPPGHHHLEFRYEPASFARGLRLAAIAAAVILVWIGVDAGKGVRRAGKIP